MSHHTSLLYCNNQLGTKQAGRSDAFYNNHPFPPVHSMLQVRQSLPQCSSIHNSGRIRRHKRTQILDLIQKRVRMRPNDGCDVFISIRHATMPIRHTMFVNMVRQPHRHDASVKPAQNKPYWSISSSLI
jgi:hypothetical protein